MPATLCQIPYAAVEAKNLSFYKVRNAEMCIKSIHFKHAHIIYVMTFESDIRNLFLLWPHTY